MSESFDPKTRLEDEKRKIPPFIKKALEYDVKITKIFVSYLLNFVPLRSLRNHCKFLEISCHGITWFAGWLAFTWLIDNRQLYNMQVNMLFGLLLDVIFVAILKASTRRRRPAVNDDIFALGPDKFSLPSGHASRAFFILTFFIWLYPISWLFWAPIIAWAFSVALSRLLIYRHHILDVCAGMLLGVLEAAILNLLWLGPGLTNWIMNTISEDNVPGGPEEI